LPVSSGDDVALAEYRGRANVILFFVCEFNWMQWRALVAQLGRMYKEFQAAGAEVPIILGDTLEHARSYAGQLKAPFPVLADPDRKV
jgi:peroxiredoxin